MSDDDGKLGPISKSAIQAGDRIAKAHGNHATVTIDADKTFAVEGGGAIDRDNKPPITWSAYVKKVWAGPWTAGSTWRW